MLARYLSGARPATALAAGVVGCPAVRFHRYTAVGVLLRVTGATVPGHLDGTVFGGRPFLGLLVGPAGALVITAVAHAGGRSTEEVSS